MNRGGPLRRSPFKSRQSPMKRSVELTRTVVKKKRAKVTPEERCARKVTKARSGGVCEICGHNRATNMHHRKNASQGGAWCPSNILHICGSGTTGDHGYVTEHPEEARRQGWSVSAYQNPADVPAWLFGHGYVLLRADGGITEYQLDAGDAA